MLVRLALVCVHRHINYQEYKDNILVCKSCRKMHRGRGAFRAMQLAVSFLPPRHVIGINLVLSCSNWENGDIRGHQRERKE